jgi:hypothetical protein
MRRRFTREERAQFVEGAKVEWRNGRHWHPGTITGPIVKDDVFDRVPLTNHATTRTVSAGDHITGSPTAVRLAPLAPPPGGTLLDAIRAESDKYRHLDGGNAR